MANTVALGVGRVRNEVVLELGLEQASVYSYGGLSSNRENLVELRHQRKPTPGDRAEFDEPAKKVGITQGGEWWLSAPGTQAVITRIHPHIERLKTRSFWRRCSLPNLLLRSLISLKLSDDGHAVFRIRYSGSGHSAKTVR
jgi:hypothetical protein